MADDQKPKTMDINDLVRELSKSSTSPGTTPPPVPAPQATRPSFPTPPSTGSGPSAKPPMSPPMAGSPTIPSSPKPPVMPQPKFSVPPPPFNQPRPPLTGQTKPAPTPSPVTPSPATPGVKEYQSSIRTMNEDISRLKQGQKPTGIDIPRKVEQTVPIPQPMPPKPTPPAGGPSQQFKVPSVNLGEAQKTGPIAQSKDFSRPGPVTPPSVPIKPKAEPKPQIYVPQEGQKGGNRNVLFIGIGVVAVLAGFLYWFFVLRSPASEVVEESPIPTPTATPAQNLSNIFTDATEIEPLAQINGGEFRKDSQQFNTPGSKAKLLELIDGVGGKYPAEMGSILGNDALTLWYGQRELFDNKGQLKTEAVIDRKLVTINEIIDTTSVPQTLASWESSISEDLKLFLTTDKTPNYKGGKVAIDFMDNFYQGVGIRYKNFPYADNSVDYAVVTAFNSKSYLVITGSREAMYATIDKLKGF